VTVRGDEQVVGRPGEVAEVVRRCQLPLCVDVVDLCLEEGGHHERPVGQPAQPGGVLDLGLHGDVTGFAHRPHSTCRSVAEPEPVVVPSGPFAVDDAIDKWHRPNSFDCGDRLTCSSNVNLRARVFGILGNEFTFVMTRGWRRVGVDLRRPLGDFSEPSTIAAMMLA